MENAIKILEKRPVGMRNLDFDWSSSIPRSIYSDGADGEGTASMAMGRRLRTDEPVACEGSHH